MLNLATKILKTEGKIYGHQWPHSVDGLRLDHEDAQEGYQPLCSTIEVEIETELGLG